MSADRPPFILAFAADSQGCSYHRILIPLAALVEAGAADGRVDMALWPDEFVKACAPDVIIWQRQVEDAQIETMRRWREALPHALFVYELDDYLAEIPKASFHRSFMPPDIEARVRKALAYCDRVTTTTEPLAQWLRGLGGRDVRVVPNGMPAARLRERQARPAGQKLRIGFAGGMSHAGDLEMLRPAMTEIGEDVTWVFMGTAPENPPCRIEFHEGVPVSVYLDGMMALDLDAVVAPLEDNPFNSCKSNLRLIEAGAMGACVIAQDVPAYRLNHPPAFAWPKNPAEWTNAIRHFMQAKQAERQREADALRAWVGRHYTLEKLMPARLAAWLPEERWKPRPAHDTTPDFVVASVDPETPTRMPFLRKGHVVTDGLEEACCKAISLGIDVLWMRPASSLSESGWKSMRDAAAQAPSIASVLPLSSDGPNSFPVLNQWSPVPGEAISLLDETAWSMFKGRRLLAPSCSGPIVLLARHALGMLGVPDVKGCGGNEEQAILEWGTRAANRKWQHVQVADAYGASAAQPEQPSQQALIRLQARGFSGVLQQPAESLTAEERERLEVALLREQWGGPQIGSGGFGTDYETWLALRRAQVDGAIPPVVSRVRAVAYGEPIPADAEWVVFVDEAMTLHSKAAAMLAAEADKDGDAAVIYADHESVLADGRRMPEFKIGFDRELFLAQDYVTPVCALRVTEISGDPPADRIALYQILLRIAFDRGAAAFRHVPHVLGSLKGSSSPEQMALDALGRQMVIQETLGSLVEIKAHKGLLGCLSVTYPWSMYYVNTPPLVSIVVPTLGSGRLIQPCVATILQHTRYPNYEIVVVQNGDRAEPELTEETRSDSRVRVVRYDDPEKRGFNWSRINNVAIREHCKGSLIVTLNDDVCVSTKWWLDNMVGMAMQERVGVVGARLVHPMGYVQHIGVFCHNGIPGHMHRGTANGAGGHLGRALLTHEASAATGACMLFFRDTFDEVGGFDEAFEHNYGDTVFCLEARRKGFRVVIEMSAELMHPEAASRPSADSPEGARRLIDETTRFSKEYPEPDPFWAPNLALHMPRIGYVHGANCDALAWTPFRPQAKSRRVLLVNDIPGLKGVSLKAMEEGYVPFLADLSGFRLRLLSPNAINMRPWDVRRPEAMALALKALGIDVVVLRSLIGSEGAAPPVEALRCLASLGIPVDVKPIEDWMVRPDSSAPPDSDGFGYVDKQAWREALASMEHAENGMAEVAD